MSESLKIMLKDIEKSKEKIKEFLKEGGVSPSGNTLVSLIKDLEKLTVVNTKKSFKAVKKNDRGYVVKVLSVDDVFEATEMPKDVEKGYYKTEAGKLVLDKKQKQLIWRL